MPLPGMMAAMRGMCFETIGAGDIEVEENASQFQGVYRPWRQLEMLF